MKTNAVFSVLKMITGLICLYLVTIAFRWGIANVYYFQANSYIDEWSYERNSLTEISYRKANGLIKKALYYHPDHNHYVHTYGRIMHWGVIAGVETVSNYQDVKSIYLEATVTRPNWSETWTDLASLNAYLYGVTDETREYIAKARATGHFTEHVMYTVSQIYLDNWDYLSNEDIRNYLQIINDSFLKEYRLAQQLELAKNYGKDKIICDLLITSPHVSDKSLKKVSERYCI
jgi:hypothetical protein